MDEQSQNYTRLHINPKTRKHNKPNYTPLILLLAQVIIFIFLGLFVLSKTSSQNSKKNTTDSKIPVTISKSDDTSPAKHQYLYIHDNNIYVYLAKDRLEKQITLKGSDTQQYKLPKWVNPTIISYEVCNYPEDKKGQFTCHFVTQSIIKSLQEELFSLSSFTDNQGYEQGGEIEEYVWDDKRTQIAYTTLAKVSDGQSLEVHLFNTDTKKDVVLGSFPYSNTRGLTIEDDTTLEFSPSGNRLLVNMTPLYPSDLNTSNDKGTFFVYDTTTRQLIYSQPHFKTSFGRFMTDNLLSLKVQDMSTDGAPTQLILYNLSNKSSKLMLSEAEDTFRYLILDSNTILLSAKNPEELKGITFFKITLDPEGVEALHDNILPVAKITDSELLIQTMKPCSLHAQSSNPCPEEILNGFEPDSYDLFDLKTKIATDTPTIVNADGTNLQDVTP